MKALVLRTGRFEKKQCNKSLYEHYIDCCEQRVIKDIRHTINQMLTLDYIVVNEDRHLNSFGLIRIFRGLT